MADPDPRGYDPEDADHDGRYDDAVHHANDNVQLLLDDAGVLVERYEYDPYGERTVYISPGSNDPDCHAPTLLPQRVNVGGIDQPYGICDTGFQGRPHCEVTGGIDHRTRVWNARFKQWQQNDHRGYIDGMNLRAGYHSMHGNLDPYGEGRIFDFVFGVYVYQDIRDKGFEVTPEVSRGAYDEFSRQNWDRTNGTLGGLSGDNVDLGTIGYGRTDEDGRSWTFDPCAREQNRCFSQCMGNLLASAGPWNVIGFDLNPFGGGPIIDVPTDPEDITESLAPSAPTIISGVIHSEQWKASPHVPRSFKPRAANYPAPPLADPAARSFRPVDPNARTGMLADAGVDLLEQSANALSVAMYFEEIDKCRRKCFK